MTVRRGTMSIDTLHEVTGERASRVRQFTTRPASDPELDEVTVTFVRLSRTSFEAIAAKLRETADVISVDTVGS